MVSTDHFRQELLTQLGRGNAGCTDMLINSGELTGDGSGPGCDAMQESSRWEEREMAHHKSNIRFFAVIAGSVLAAALLVALLVGGQVAGPKVAFNASPPITAR